MDPFPQQLEFIEFFGAEPELTDPGVVWFYNCLSFRFDEGHDSVLVELEPASRVMRVVWTQSGEERLRLDLSGVDSLTLDRDEGQDTIVAQQAGQGDLRFRLRPTVHLQWSSWHDGRPTR